MPNPEYLAELDRRYRARLEAATEELRRSFEQRLRAATEGLASALAEVRATPPESLLEAADFAPLESAARGQGERSAYEALLEAAVAFDGAASQGALLDALLDHACRFAPRAAVLIAERDGARGWSARGFAEAAERFAGRRTGWSGEALTAFAAGEGVVRARGTAAAELADQLELPAASESLLVPLVLRDRVAAALYVDRRSDEPELPLGALQLVALGAAQRLELQALATRAYTPTLHEAGALDRPGLPLWDPTALGEPEVEVEPEVEAELEAELEAAAPPPTAEPAPAEVWADEAAGAVFELEPEGAELEAAPAGEPEAAPGAGLEPPALETVSRVGIEELFEAEAPAPIAPPAPAPEPPVWTGPEVVSWAQPEPLAPPAAPSDSWSAQDVAAWTAPAPEPAPTPPSAEPEAAGAPEWEADEGGDATVLIGGAGRGELPARPQPEESTAPFELPPTAPAPPQLGFEPAPGAVTSEIPTPETTAPIPTFAPPPSMATIAVPTLSVPIAPDLTEDATLLVARPGAAAPPVAPPPEPAAAEPPEDQTHPSLRSAPAAAEEDVNDRTATRGPRGTEVAPPPDLQGPGLAFTMSRTQRASGENALHEEARRLARLLVSEIKLYNEEQVEEGRRHRDLYLRLREDIDRSRQIYDERVHDSVRGTADYFQQELIRSLAGGDPRALGM